VVQKSTGGIIPYAQQWNITLEKQFGDNILISGAYVGNKGSHLYDSLGINQLSHRCTTWARLCWVEHHFPRL